MALKVTNSPFTEEQVNLLNQLLPTLNELQKIWLIGYLSATSHLESDRAAKTITNNAKIEKYEEKNEVKEVTILYGSQTGNAKNLAENGAKTLEKEGFIVEISSMDNFKPNKLKNIKRLLIFVSTYGEGTPPDNALSFYEFLHSKRAPKLEGLEYSVLALGDSSYEFFCQTGKDFDARLEQLGAKRIYERADCDLDFEAPAEKWLQGVIDYWKKTSISNNIAAETSVQNLSKTNFSRNRPFYAEVLENINLNGRGSNKETRHIELSLEGSGLTYQPGDALGIYPQNNPQLVSELIAELALNKNEQVTAGDSIVTLEEALISHFEITVLTGPLLEKICTYSSNDDLKKLLANETELKQYIKGRDLLDLVRDFGPWKITGQELISVLRKMPPRLYSISSSYETNPEEVHITVGAVRYEAHGRKREGVCSVYCAERLQVGDKLPIFIQPNEHFRLPENPDAPIIMIGAGTGIAPFRAFMQHREEIGAKGKAWLFFGDQHFVTDFLYQIEWQRWLKEGVLTKMNVAFSRDTDKKVYVQHKMLKHSKELYQWLEEGAYIYVCGDKDRMAKDVHETLISIISKEGQLNYEDAENYLKELQQQKRYQRDVY